MEEKNIKDQQTVCSITYLLCNDITLALQKNLYENFDYGRWFLERQHVIKIYYQQLKSGGHIRGKTGWRVESVVNLEQV